MDDVLLEFISEAREALASIEAARTALAWRPEDGSALEALSDCLHGIKGPCGYLGLDALESAIEEVEGRLLDVMNGASVADLDPALDTVQDLLGQVVGESPIVAPVTETMGEVWRGLPRLVRYLASRLGKDVRLVLEGGATAVPAALRPAVRTALVQLVRNACDHGIEMPAARERGGKARRGLVRVAARETGGRLVIEITDDGRGIDAERLRARAVAAGMVGAARMDHQALLGLVFRRGLTTAPHGGISGRGVGMTLTRSRVSAAGGTVSMASRPGLETVVTVSLPLAASNTTPAGVVAAA